MNIHPAFDARNPATRHAGESRHPRLAGRAKSKQKKYKQERASFLKKRTGPPGGKKLSLLRALATPVPKPAGNILSGGRGDLDYSASSIESFSYFIAFALRPVHTSWPGLTGPSTPLPTRHGPVNPSHPVASARRTESFFAARRPGSFFSKKEALTSALMSTK
jgi:hypothetical protein